VTSFENLYDLEPHIFSKEFEVARYVVLPLCASNHWIVAIADLLNQEIMIFNSLDERSNTMYKKLHKDSFVWLKYFLSWRLSKS
jgi:hypothetical protein